MRTTILFRNSPEVTTVTIEGVHIDPAKVWISIQPWSQGHPKAVNDSDIEIRHE